MLTMVGIVVLSVVSMFQSHFLCRQVVRGSFVIPAQTKIAVKLLNKTVKCRAVTPSKNLLKIDKIWNYIGIPSISPFFFPTYVGIGTKSSQSVHPFK